MLPPFGGPRGMVEHVLAREPPRGVVRIDGVVAQLVDVGVGLVGNPLPVTVDVEPEETRGLDAVLAEPPDLLEGRVGAGE